VTPIGEVISRTDAAAKASGQARYTQDIYPAGMLHGVVVRSPHASARINRIDKSRASAAPGVVCVLDANDVPEIYAGMIFQEEPLLARRVVRYVGEPVALVAAESKAEAVAAAGLVDVDYTLLPCVVDLETALEPAAARVHEHKSNVMDPSVIARGDAQSAFETAHAVVKTRVRTQRVHQGYLEPRVALAEIADRGLVITTSTQSPFAVRSSVATLLGLSVADVLVRAPAVGGGFGGKLQPGVAPHAAALALATKRPVQIVSSRAEELQASNPREDALIELESAIDMDGRILARRARVWVDAGAYAAETPAVASVTALQSTGPYSIDHVDAVAHAVYTNTASTGAMRGPGAPQMMYATEAHMNDVANELGITPAELRRRNLLRDGSTGPTGQPIDDPAVEECLNRVVSRLDAWRAEQGDEPESQWRRGYGLALGWWSTGIAAGSAATIVMSEDGIATIHTGATEIGTGAVVSGATALAAAELGVGIDRVRLVSGSTDEPYDAGSEGSRTMYGVGSAVRAAARDVKDILASAVADHHEANKNDIEFEGGRVLVAGSPQTSLTMAEAVGLASAGGPVVGTGRFFATPAEFDHSCVTGMFLGANNEPTFHCHGAEVLVDVQTGRVRVTRYVAAHDTGRVVNPMGVRGQVEGGVVQGIGYALFEEVLTASDGRTANDNLADYRMPTIADIPSVLEVELVEGHEALHGPLGAKGVGEAPALLPPAALGSAIRDAIGTQPHELPMTPDRVLACAAGSLV
jgi:CO/xanthine dehydrogenase Mo-binding subunit